MPVDIKKRDKLIEDHMLMVHKIASRASLIVSCSLGDRDDLVQDGMLALVKLADQYEETMGCSFVSFAYMRIKGAMYDRVRKETFLPRTRARKAKEIRKAIDVIAIDSNPDSVRIGEISEYLGIEKEEIFKAIATGFYTENIEFDSETFMDMYGESAVPVDILTERRFSVDELFVEVCKLSKRERTIFFRYFIQGKTLKNIGISLGISKTRTTQIKDGILRSIRSGLSEKKTAEINQIAA